jgi:hypothetical protein
MTLRTPSERLRATAAGGRAGRKAGVGRRAAVVALGTWAAAGALAQTAPAGAAPSASAPVAGSARPAALPGLQLLDAVRTDEGLLVSFVLAFELPRPVEDALLKGVPLHFTAQAMLMRERWYWTDRRMNTAVRGWRLTYQPLTRRFRVGSGGLTQSFDTLDEALAAVGRATRWKVAEPSQLDDGERHYLVFDYRLDTSLLPRPMQIGIGGQADWNVAFGRTLRLD